MKQRYLITRIHSEIENLITAKNEVFKKHSKNNRNRYYTCKYKVLQRKLENFVGSSKQSYFKRVSQKLSSIITSSKCYCSLLKRMLMTRKFL